MRRFVRLTVLSFLPFFLAAAASAASLKQTGQAVAGEILIKIQAGASTNDVQGLERLADADQSERISNTRSGAIYRMHSRSKASDAIATALLKNPNVVYAEPNYIVRLTVSPNDPQYSSLWGLKNTGQFVSGVAGVSGADIKAELAWGVTTGSASVVVGVVDTGIDYTHPDLAANVWNNPGGKGNALCAAGTHGFNAITKTCDPKDDHYHGTHVSGTIGAVGNNGAGVAGVNWTTSIMGLKFLDASGSGTTANAIAAIDFAVQAKIDGVNIRVLSNSWGGGAFSKALLDEINKANENDILFVASAGNDASNNDTFPTYPAAYATQNMIAVAATDNRDALAYFSNYGATTVHLGAPGVSVYSTTPGNSYSSLSGTSMAAPHVAGVAALVLAHSPSLTTAQLKSAILDNTDPIPSLTGKTVTGGRLDAAKAVGAAVPPDFVLAVTPVLRSVTPGSPTSYVVTITPTDGFSGSVDLSVTGLPSGVSASFTPPSTTSSSTLFLTTTPAVTPNNYLLTVTGVSGALTHSTTMQLLVGSKPPTSPCPTFSQFFSTYYTVNATALAADDFNGDGSLDLAVTTGKTVLILKGTNGSFVVGSSYQTGTAALAVASGDFNRDGKIDLAVANAGANNVSILLGNGDGTFAAATNYATGTSPFAVAVGDFNADGKLDVVTANNGSSGVSILLGNGDGTLQAAASYTAGSGPFSVAVADFDRDGKSDLVVAEYNSAKVSVLLGNGDGTFAAPVHYATGNNPSSVAAGDLNGDGKADLVVANFGSNSVSYLLGNGNGTFQAAITTAVGTNPVSVAIGDVNGDGKNDIAVANGSSSNISVFFNNGAGGFTPVVNYASADGLTQLVIGDFNQDGRADLVPSSSSYGPVAHFNSGTCATNCSTMATAVDFSAGTTPDSVVTADFNNDGKTDVVAANSGSNDFTIRLGNGDGTFQSAVPGGAGTAPASLASGDFNHDGKTDLAVANSGSGNVSIFIGNGDGAFQGAVNYSAGTNPHSVAVGDFNRDGKDDLAVAGFGSNNVSVLRGNGDGTFQTAVPYGAGTNPESVSIADFNRDGKLDLAVANSGSGNISVLLGNGDATFQAATNFTVGTNPVFVLAGDINGDGIADLAAANSGSNNVTIRYGIGNGSFQAGVNYGVGTSPRGIAMADFNVDGRRDLAVVNHDSNNVSLLFGVLGGTLTVGPVSNAGSGPAAVAAGDVNGDGKADFIVANSSAGTLSMLLNTCPTPDLTLTKTHSGTFAQGETGKTFTLTVTNSGLAATDNVVKVTEVPPAGLSVTGMSGTGWTCVLGTLSCSRGDVLAAGGSYSPVTVTVNIASSAPASLINNANVSGGGESNTANDAATDTATVTQVTDLIVASTHDGSFLQGDAARNYTIIVRNAGGLAAGGSVTVTDTLPASLTATAMSGGGWNCTVGSLTCTRADGLAANSSYPPIILTVSVAANAPASVINLVTVSGGGDANVGNNNASDPTLIWSAQSCGSFGSPLLTSVNGPTSIANGDFNADGKADLVTSNYSDDTVSVFLGNGDGTLAPKVNYVVGDSPQFVAAGDLNHDGKADLVVANYYSHTLSVLLGNGDGTFGTAVNYASGSTNSFYPVSLVFGDFNNDGNLDVAATSDYSNVSIFIGNGSGGLAYSAAYPINTGGYPGRVVSGDLNGDGKADLAIAVAYDGIEVMLGNGDGTFQSTVHYESGYYSYGVAINDFNHDGKLDLAVANYYAANVGILLGNGNGTFQSPVFYNTTYGSRFISTEDVNGDGNVDLAIANFGSDSVSILLGNGNGTFQGASSFASGYGPYGVVISDFNGDGRPDLATANYYGSSVGIMLGGCFDLSITKSHTGNFSGGQQGTYSIAVKNVGGAGSGGTVTVTDVLPAGLTATSIFGSGWNCALANLRCTRSDSLANGLTYPLITVNVNVDIATGNVTNVANLTSSGDSNAANNSSSDPTTISQVADLTIAMTHDGTWASGQTGRTYTITVGNSGGNPTSGTVTVIDSTPFAFNVTAMSGTGWTCSAGSRTCTRTDALGVNATYPPIIVTVSIDAFNSQSTLVNNASVSGGGESNTANDLASDTTKVLVQPLLTATALSTTQVNLTWSAIQYATGYQLLRSSNNGPYNVVAAPLSNSFSDTSLSANTTYLYRVRAIDPTVSGPLSATDLATTMFFTDNIAAGVTSIKAIHINELRAAVNIVRAAAGLPATTFTDTPVMAGYLMRGVHIKELRTALDQARSTLGLPTLFYTDSTLPAGSRIKAAHLLELRAGVK